MREWSIGHDPNSMGQEVVLELPGRHKDCIEQLLDLGVPCLIILQNLTDKVHGSLFDFCRDFMPFNSNNGADNYVGGCNISSSDFGGTSVGKEFRYCLSSMKAAVA
jgi:hypothetical protein